LGEGKVKRKVIIISSLVVISVSFWFASFIYPNIYLQRAFYTALALSISYLVFKFLLEEIVSTRIEEDKTRYSFKKITSILYILTFIAAAIAIWVEHPQALLVSYGVLAAGAAFALQDLIRNLAGGIVVFISGIYRVGDRIEVDAKTGDVIDIGIMYTTLLEIKDWVSGDQPTGRLTTIPNSHVLSNTVNNYTRDHNYIWDEISIPITYDSDWKEAISKMAGIVEKETQKTTDEAESSISRLGEKYYLPKRAMEPTIFLTLTDNWIMLNIRYITPVRQRRPVSSNLSRILLEELQKSDSIKIASETIDIGISGVTEIEVKKQDKTQRQETEEHSEPRDT
jgi:small-conductance mechanosensitive channel